MKKENLHNIKKTGFKTPENYFETFSERLNERLNEKDVIGVKNAGFKIPENYFETFESNFTDKLNDKEETKIIQFKSKRTWYYAAGIAASIVLLLSIIFTNKNGISIDKLETVAIESYLYQEEYSAEELTSLFQLNEISETDFIKLNISEETLNNYLENIDTEDFILE